MSDMKWQTIPVEDLKPAEYNPRKKLKAGDKEYEKIKNSILEFGYVEPIIVNYDMTVIGGHQRLTVLKDLGHTEVQCVVLEIKEDAKVKALNIALNKIAGEWDEKMLDVSICADDVPAGRPAPYMIFKAMEAAGVQDVNKVIKLGDPPFDMLAGSRAGLRGVIGVLSGSHTAVSLGSVRHTHIIESVADLPALLDREFVK